MRTSLIISTVALLAALPVFAQDEVDAFMTKFEEAVKADNYASMKELVAKAGPKSVKNGYWRWEYQLASAIANKSEEDKTHRQNVMEKLTSLISQEFKDRLPSERLVWTKGLTPELAAKRVQMGDTMTEAEQLLGRAEKANDKPMFQQAAAKYVAAAALAAETKDLYWDLSDFTWLAFIADKLEEKYDTAYWYKKALESARERKLMDYVAEFQIPEKLKRLARGGLRDDLIDHTIPLEESKKKYATTMEKLAAEAVNPGTPGTDSKPAGAPGSPAASGGTKAAMPGTLPPPANKHTMRIEWVDAEKVAYKDANGRPTMTPNIRANAHWVHWIQTEMGPTAALENPAIVPGDHTFRFEKGKLIFDPDGKGKAGEERLKVQRGKPELLVFKQRVLPDGSKVDARFLAMEAPNAFTVNGVGMTFENPGPNDPLRLRWQGATAATSKFDGWDVTIFDDSADGKFDAYGDDSVMISKGKTGRVVPLSRYVYVGDLLFEMKLDASGQNLRFKPYDGPIALLQFEYVANTMPAFMILEGLNENAQFFINLMDCKDKPMWVARRVQVQERLLRLRRGRQARDDLGRQRQVRAVQGRRGNAQQGADGRRQGAWLHVHLEDRPGEGEGQDHHQPARQEHPGLRLRERGVHVLLRRAVQAHGQDARRKGRSGLLREADEGAREGRRPGQHAVGHRPALPEEHRRREVGVGRRLHPAGRRASQARQDHLGSHPGRVT